MTKNKFFQKQADSEESVPENSQEPDEKMGKREKKLYIPSDKEFSRGGPVDLP